MSYLVFSDFVFIEVCWLEGRPRLKRRTDRHAPMSNNRLFPAPIPLPIVLITWGSSVEMIVWPKSGLFSPAGPDGKMSLMPETSDSG